VLILTPLYFILNGFYSTLGILVYIGHKIKADVEKKGMTVSEFARRINKSRENAYSIFRRKSIDTELLVNISKVLAVDFFQHFTSLTTENLKLQEENTRLKEMIKLLQEKNNAVALTIKPKLIPNKKSITIKKRK
jgi:transcriptional regulator with XRE-family HTH domain